MSVEVLKQIWPEWQIEGKPLGKGSFGVVYKAVRRDHNVESYAAIKVISIPADPSEVDSLRSEGLDMNATRTYLQGIVNDFVSEIQLMESLKGAQNIVSVEDYKVVEKANEIGWDIYIRMELLTSFNTYICDKKLTEEEIIKLGCDICTALEICAKRNIIHRDIKPENIFINDFGYFKLGDFGIARKMENMTGGLSQKGTFNYMAPEVANSSEYDARVDTYSLGIVLYRLLNGNRLPFLDTEKQLLNPNERRNAVDRRIRGEELPAPCDASPAMADLILRACAYDPDMRFSSATEMKQALMSVANGTYQMGASNLDRTTSVRRAPANYDKTTSVRKAPTASNQKSAPAVSTFGAAPKKKNKMPAVIAVVLAVVLLVGVGIFAVPKLLDGNDSTGPEETAGQTTSETADYSKFDEEQIASIISEADTLAAEEDYEGALVKVQTGLVTYPKSVELQDKADEYENAYVDEVIAEADRLMTDHDFTNAINVINSALKIVPGNTKLIDKQSEINNAKPISLSKISVFNGGWEWNNLDPTDSFGNVYSTACNYVVFSDYYDNILPQEGHGGEVNGYRQVFAEYHTNGEYSTLSMLLAPHTEICQNGKAFIQVYADNGLVYTSPTITRKTDAFICEVEIAGAEYIKIVANVYIGSVIDGGDEGAIIIADAQLWPN